MGHALYPLVTHPETSPYAGKSWMVHMSMAFKLNVVLAVGSVQSNTVPIPLPKALGTRQSGRPSQPSSLVLVKRVI
jgi:hypothetical protein